MSLFPKKVECSFKVACVEGFKSFLSSYNCMNKNGDFNRREGAGWAHYHLKGHAPKRVAVNRAVFEKVKRVLFYTTIKKF